ncbi:hypothetical protein Poly30_44540 [Planctomycetes bacterium Poly30]|uniref:Uncharacterized protein n=1 Tax=Saltatorellus ferox TaxID=2528018 RepID=A0A518EXT6_9BACT|nr:hypothetical protein Poly30_44540 [Planctomycetes bacterium Poly30]
MHVPVWHAKTKALVESGDLFIVGIVQEQHPDRAALYAQWQELDFPLLWDPFGVTGLNVVPVVSAIDANGVVRIGRPDPRKFDEQFVAEFMGAEFPSTETPAAGGFVVSALAGGESGQGRAMARVLLEGVGPHPFRHEALDALGALTSYSATPFDRFSAGVALRLRHDSAQAEPGDFQRALALWSSALHAEPNQYIWRRRIQQWGPRLDKPYPFYDWIGTAAAEVTARGETPVQVRAQLSGSEVADKTRKLPGSRVGTAPDGAEAVAQEPDPRGEVTRDLESIVGLELAVAQHTASAGGSVRSPLGSSRVHVTLRPAEGAKWPLDAEPPVVWLDLPEGWDAAAPGFRFPMPKEGQTSGPLTADFEISTLPIPLGPPDESAALPESVLPAYVVYSVCQSDGTCIFRRQEFRIEVTFPAMPDMGPPPESGDDDKD